VIKTKERISAAVPPGQSVLARNYHHVRSFLHYPGSTDNRGRTEKGTLERFIDDASHANELFAGKFLSGVLRAFVQTLILLILSYIVFQLFTPISFLEILVIALIFSAAASALGMVIAAISRTPDQAIWISVFSLMYA